MLFFCLGRSPFQKLIFIFQDTAQTLHPLENLYRFFLGGLICFLLLVPKLYGDPSVTLFKLKGFKTIFPSRRWEPIHVKNNI